MRTWVIALIVLMILAAAGGCSSSAPEVSAALAPAGDAAGSGTRHASALSWGSPTVLESTPPHCTIGRSLAMIGGNPAVSYMIFSDQGPEPGFTVYYARANDSAGTSWEDPVAVAFWMYVHDYNNCTSLREVNGKPAIAYWAMPYGAMYCQVLYVRAKDATGKNWGTPVIVAPNDNEGPDFQGEGTTMYIVNGNPAVRYMDAGNQKLVRALDVNGRYWGSPQIIGPGTFSIVNGYPTLRYSTDGVLYWRRAADANGDSWLDPVIIGYGNGFGSFDIVNEQPAVTYGDGSGVLYYCRAADAYGDSWGTPVNIGYGNSIGSFAYVNGHPSVTYRESETLYFVRAADANGDSWGAPQTALAGAEPAAQQTQVVVDGKPAIVFSGWGSSPGSSVRFIRALDADGTTWPSNPVDVTVGGDASNEWIRNTRFINGLLSIFFLSGINVAEEGAPPAYNTKYLNFVQALDSSGSAWETPETVVDFGYNKNLCAVTTSESSAGIAYTDVWHALNFIASTGAAPPPPDPAVDVQLSTDKSAYIIGQDTQAVLTAVVTDEYGDPISGLLTGAFAATLDGVSVSLAFSEGSAGTYTATLGIEGLAAGPHSVQTEVTDTRGISGSDSATFSMYEPGAGGTMHVGDLDADTVLANKNRWCAVFTVKIEDSSEIPVSSADVSFSLSGDDSGSGQVTTGSDGTASYQSGWINGSGSVTFTVNDVTHATLTYSSADNHDPDGDSDGTSITISGP